jgi:hypothetical protein
MKKQAMQIEVIRPRAESKSDEAMERPASLVAQRLSQGQAKSPEEMTTAELTDEVLAHPWVLPREVAYSIMRLLPVSHQAKYRYRYDDYGCFRCGTKDEPHQSLSLCKRCYALLHAQIKAGIMKHARSEDLSPAQLTANLTRTSDNARRILAEITAGHAPVAKPTKRLGRPRLGDSRGTGR